MRPVICSSVLSNGAHANRMHMASVDVHALAEKAGWSASCYIANYTTTLACASVA